VTVAEPHEAVLEVKRSRFLCQLQRVETEAAARAVVDAARRRHWDARHHCSAFVLGGPPERVERSSDDGEPSGTAGAPMLQVLRERGAGDLVAVVTRWFGGTLLGTGGLVRAYTRVVANALESAPLVRRELRVLVEISVPVGESGRVEGALRGAGFAVIATSYTGLTARLRVALIPGAEDSLAHRVAALTGGRSRPGRGEPAWVDLPHSATECPRRPPEKGGPGRWHS